MISTLLALTQTLREIYRNKMISVGELEPDLVYLQYKNKHLTMTYLSGYTQYVKQFHVHQPSMKFVFPVKIIFKSWGINP